MSKVWVRANIEDAYIEALIEGWVDEDDWRRACDECAVPMHVTHVLSLRVKVIGGGWYPTWFEIGHAIGSVSNDDAVEELRHGWLSDGEEWRPRVLGSEMTVVRAPGPPPGAVPLLEADQ